MEIGTGRAENEEGIRAGCIKKDFQGVWPTGWVLRYEQNNREGEHNAKKYKNNDC